MNAKIIKSERYEDMAVAFQCSQIQALDKVLAEHGIARSLAREIVESFTFKSSVLLDQSWIESEEGKVFPTVVFSFTHQDFEPSEFYFNTGVFSFTEYTLGNLSWYYDDNEPVEEPQKTGIMGPGGSAT